MTMVKPGKWLREFGIIFAVWTAMGLLMAVQMYILGRGSHHPPTWRQVLIPALLSRWIFALLTPGALWFSSLVPLARGRWLRTLGWNILGATAFLVLWVSIRLPLYPITDPVTGMKLGPSWRVYQDMILEDACYACIVYAGLVAVSQLWEYYRRYRERELRASRLEAELEQARLNVLRMRMDPQFLFATLHSISTLIEENVEAADNLVASLSELLRISLDAADEPEVTLKREMEHLQVYLEVLQIRMNHRLDTRVTIDPKSLDALVPSMILIPLLESSTRRGLEKGHPAGALELRSAVEDGKLRIEICDALLSGKEDQRDWELDPGLVNARARLRHLYGASHNFAGGWNAEGNFWLKFEIPLVVRPDPPGEQLVGQPWFEEA